MNVGNMIGTVAVIAVVAACAFVYACLLVSHYRQLPKDKDETKKG